MALTGLILDVIILNMGVRYGVDFTGRKNYLDFSEEEYEKILIGTSETIKNEHSDMAFLSGAYYDRGIVYFVREEYEKSISDYSSCIKIREEFNLPFLSEVYYQRGDALSNFGKYNEALADFEKSFSLKPDAYDTKQQIEFLKEKIMKISVS